jgi:hypothetical protein
MEKDTRLFEAIANEVIRPLHVTRQRALQKPRGSSESALVLSSAFRLLGRSQAKA